MVTNTFTSGAYFTSVEIGTDHITLEGVAENSFTVIDYTTALEKSGKFPEVRIAQIGDRGGSGAKSTRVKSTGVSFTIAIRK
ncbi:PilN domain-containing protein [Chloroflexota bacterium]